ncbi:MAG TPA: asparagine synthase (glutamine-hydrolyzing) [Acidimicrobiales bacterium]|jgi:asparagine synthase (glutamine-hydrolysing)
MCGIAGVLNGPGQAPVSLERLRTMAAALSHRGPDGWGLYRDDRIGLAHARLSIIDLTSGDQPLTNEDGTVWLSYNGEIFNYVELRRELAAAGHVFATTGDSEVIVHGYEQWGDGVWARLNGQFALALWDSRARQLWLVRDRVGILPLHYALDGRRMVFGSEAKALFASGYVEPRLNPDGITDVFTRWSTTAPRTVFEGVRSVRPGTALCVDASLGIREQRWWHPTLSVDPDLADLSLDDAADALGQRLGEAVSLRLRADVPVGAYLSGGLDSSVIGSLVHQGDSPLETFAVRFADPAFDETAEQRRMAELLGTRHHEVVCGPDEIATALLDVVWHCETPLLRTAPVPLFLLSGLVREAGMKVVLTGEGADELLAGYSIFKEDAVRRFWARRPSSTMRPALAGKLHPEVAASGTRGTDLWARFFRRDLEATDHRFYAHLIRWQNTAWARRVLAPELRTGSEPDDEPPDLVAELPSDYADAAPLARAQWVELVSFMSSYLLSYQGDRVAMAHGVEVRYPFLDPAVIEWSLRLPTRLKMPGFRDKVALRRLASRSLPPEIWQRPKQPYRAPMTTALFGPQAPDYVRELLGASAVERLGLLDPRAVRILSERAFDRKGEMAGEREEMALVGALTLQALGQAYLVELPQRIAEARSQLDGVAPTVLVDRAREVAPA